MDEYNAQDWPDDQHTQAPGAPTKSAISTKLFLALGLITITAIVAGAASIVSLNKFQHNYDNLINAELPTLEDTANISQLSMSVVGRGANLIVAPTSWARANLIAQVEDDAKWLEEIVTGISDEALSSTRKQELLNLKDQLFATYNTLNTLTENRIVYAERLSEIDEEIMRLQQDLISVQAATNLPDGGIAPSGPLRQWNESIHSALFLLTQASRMKHAAPLGNIEKKAKRRIGGVFIHRKFLPSELHLDAEDTLQRLDEIALGRNGLFQVKRLDLDALNQIEATLRTGRTIAEQFISSADLATQDIRVAITDANRQTSQSMNITLQAMIGFILVSVLVAIATFLYVNRTVLRRLGHLRMSMVAHAEGEFAQIDTRGDDEITDMARSLQYLVDTLHSRETGLMDARDEAEKASVAKTRFLAAASHDLRQPLQALNLFVYALESKEEDEEKREIIKLIRNTLESLKELLNTLLDISKLEAGVVQPQLKDFSTGFMFERIKSELGPVAWASDLELKVVDSSVQIHSDPSLLETVIRNLVDNAIKYTERGTVLVGCRHRKNRLRIEVWDTGPGIPEEQRHLIFQDFYQADNPARQRTQGLGLGLSIVRRMSDLLGCLMGCESVVGRGSVFWVEVPVARERIQPPISFTPIRVNRGSAHIVVIEDDEQVLAGLKALLENAGHTVDAYHTGNPQTLRSAFINAKQTPDIIIADYRLDAEFTGRGAIDLIRKTLATKIPAIIVTGDTAPERLREAKESGYPILHKPVRPEELLNMVHETLSRAGSEDDS
ncbi:ATP-binding protein [Magnetovibrio sp. PR-2]|uniref:ATP-binding protein n=1 Tax=Magnetovibrio sp. PR-2 TaxID=3120356 RepID=UPI002FCE26C4